MKFAVSIFIICFIAVTRSQELADEECQAIREKLTKNMAIIEHTADTAQMIQQRDCNFAKSSVKLTKKYNKCIPSDGQQGMQNVFKNMKFISRIICENVNKRLLGCFSPENLRQFNQCTNKTIQYMDYIAKKRKESESTSLSTAKPQIRKKRFLFQDIFSSISDGIQGTLKTGAGFLPRGGLLKRSGSMKSDGDSFEHHCCMVHLKSDCFLNKVVHTCAEKADLRLAKAFQTVLGLAVRDAVEIACGKIQTLDQCEQFQIQSEVDDLGF